MKRNEKPECLSHDVTNPMRAKVAIEQQIVIGRSGLDGKNVQDEADEFSERATEMGGGNATWVGNEGPQKTTSEHLNLESSP